MTLSGWAVSGLVFLVGPTPTFPSGSQFVAVGPGGEGASVSQALDGTVLAGTTVTFQITSLDSGQITLGEETQAVSGSAVMTHMVTFAVPADAPADLLLTLSSSEVDGWAIDLITGSYAASCPPPTTTTTTVPVTTTTDAATTTTAAGSTTTTAVGVSSTTLATTGGGANANVAFAAAMAVLAGTIALLTARRRPA